MKLWGGKMMSGRRVEESGLQLTRQITKVIGDATYAEDGSILVKWNLIMWQIAPLTLKLCMILTIIYIRHITSAIGKKALAMLKLKKASISISETNITHKESKR